MGETGKRRLPLQWATNTTPPDYHLTLRGKLIVLLQVYGAAERQSE